jgi:hypothetical protein
LRSVAVLGQRAIRSTADKRLGNRARRPCATDATRESDLHGALSTSARPTNEGVDHGFAGLDGLGLAGLVACRACRACRVCRAWDRLGAWARLIPSVASSALALAPEPRRACSSGSGVSVLRLVPALGRSTRVTSLQVPTRPPRVRELPPPRSRCSGHRDAFREGSRGQMRRWSVPPRPSL